MGTNVSTPQNGRSGRISFDASYQRGKRILSYDDQAATSRSVITRRQSVAVTKRPETLPSTSRSETLHLRRGTLTTNDQPKPLPSTSKKKDFLKDVDFSDIDYIVSQAPLDILTKTMWDVVEYLVITPSGKQIDNMLKIRAIFRWMTSYDVYGIDAEIIPPTDSPLEHMLKIQCDLTSHAQMVYTLCMLADIPCVIINGITKGGSYEVGSDIKYDELTSQWNAVYINDQWRFIDVFWASTCVLGTTDDNTIFIGTDGKISQKGDIDRTIKFNEFYFFTDPDQLISTHLPDDDEWQLLPVPIHMSKFQKMPYLREHFHLYEMTILEKSNKVCKLVAENETINISFGLPEDRSENYMFKFMLSQKRTQIESNKPVDILLERFVGVIHMKDKVTFKVRLPFYGKYQFDVYGCDFSKSNNFSLLCTYMIDCIDPKDPCLPFPDCPDVGFGNNPHANKIDIYAESPMTPFVRTQNGIVEFIIKVGKNHEISHILKSLLIDSGLLSRHVVARREGDRYRANLKLPREGEYVIKFYIGQSEDNIEYNLPPDLLNFVIKFKGDERPSNLPFPNVPDGQLGAKLDAVSLGVKCLSETGDYVKAPEGKATFLFKADDSVKLMYELSCCKREGNTRVSVDTDITDGVWKFDVDMPVPAEYSMNVFAFKDNDESKLYQVHSFFIHSEGNIPRRVRFYDDSFVENLISDAVVTSDDYIVISIPPLETYEKLFTTVRKTDQKYYEYENNVKILMHNDRIEMILNDYGEYVLEVFTRDVYDNSINTTGRFYIHRKKEEDIYEDDFQELVNTLKPRIDDQPVEEPIPDRKDSVFEPSQFDEIGSQDSDSDNGDIGNEEETDDEEKLRNGQKSENDETMLMYDSVPETSDYMTDDTKSLALTEDRKSLVLTEDTKSLALTEETKSLALTDNNDLQEEEIEEEAKQKFKIAKEKSIKKNMTKAIKSKNLQEMRKELKRYKAFDLNPEDKMVVYVQKVVNELAAKEKMAEACCLRNTKEIQKSIDMAREANFDHHLDMQIALSVKILNRVKEIERITKPLLKMNQQMLTEMKKYQKPPNGVHQVLRATCLLLGDDPKHLRKWKTCQGALFKTGKEHMMRRVSQFDINSASPEILKKIQTILKPFTLAQIRDVSKGAATFFVWVTDIIKEIESRQKTLHKTRSLRSALPRPAMMNDHHQNSVLKI